MLSLSRTTQKRTAPSFISSSRTWILELFLYYTVWRLYFRLLYYCGLSVYLCNPYWTELNWTSIGIFRMQLSLLIIFILTFCNIHVLDCYLMRFFSYHLFSICFHLRYETDVLFLTFLCAVAVIGMTAVMPTL